MSQDKVMNDLLFVTDSNRFRLELGIKVNQRYKSQHDYVNGWNLLNLSYFVLFYKFDFKISEDKDIYTRYSRISIHTRDNCPETGFRIKLNWIIS